MPETSCTEFEVAIERELHGALDAEGARQLAEHLRTCPTCPAYRQAAKEMETNMETTADRFSAGVEWGTLKTKVDAQLTRASMQRWAMLLFGVGSFAIAILTEQRMPSWDVFALIGGILAIAFFSAQRRLNALVEDARAAQSSDDLFTFLVAENARHTRRALIGIALTVAGAIRLAFLGTHEPRLWLLAALLVVAIGVAIGRLITLRRERAELRR
jgi:hypothetical protein